MEKIKIRNSSVDLFRYLCAVMVVAIHTSPLAEFNDILGYSVSQILTRIAVPFFFCTAGYYYMRKLDAGEDCFWPYLRRLLKTYIGWSGVYYLLDFVQWGYANLRSFVINTVYTFFITGSYYHFWFIVGLIFSVCLTTLLYKVGGRKLMVLLSLGLYALGCLACAYGNVCGRIPGLSALLAAEHFELIRRYLLMGFPFFVSGAVVAGIDASAISSRGLATAWWGSFLLWLGEALLVLTLGWGEDIVLSFGLYPLTVMTLVVLLRHPMPQLIGLSRKCRMLADFTYFAHPLCIVLLSAIFGELAPTAVFLLTVAVAGIAGMIYRKIKSPAIG